jgi:sulfide:quinone oxidoreductase
MSPIGKVHYSTRRAFLALAAAGGALAALPSTDASAAVSGPPVQTSAKVVIIGAGAAGSALANRLRNRLEGAEITIVDPRAQHLYQPGLTLVAAGLKAGGYVVSQTTDWIARGVRLVPERVAMVDAEAQTVATEAGTVLDYDFLVLAPGLVLDHDAIEGFSLDMVGAERDRCALRRARLRRAHLGGGLAISSKTAGGASSPARDRDEMRRRAAQAHLPDRRPPAPGGQPRECRGDLCRPAGQPLRRAHRGREGAHAVRRPGIETQMRTHADRHRRGPEDRHLRDRRWRGGGGLRLPPRHPAAARAGIRRAVGLHWADRWVGQGWAEVDQYTLRHARYPNIFAAGDIAGVPKGKTAASAKWQVPVVEDHLVAATQGREGTATYNGYTSCPMITRIGRAMLIEFDYNNNLTPSFPGVIAPLEELWISWLMKEVALKATYNAMLRGMA